MATTDPDLEKLMQERFTDPVQSGLDEGLRVVANLQEDGEHFQAAVLDGDRSLFDLQGMQVSDLQDEEEARGLARVFLEAFELASQ